MSADKLVDFMKGLTAAVELHNLAGEKGCFVESVCLAASIVDGSLRIGLILQHQLDTGSDALLEDLLHQSDSDRIISERDMYRRALDSSVIDTETFEELQSLYNERNKVVHRYIISEITTTDLLRIALRYDQLINRVSDFIAKLEAEQIKRGIGMTQPEEDATELQELKDFCTTKHGGVAKALRTTTVQHTDTGVDAANET